MGESGWHGYFKNGLDHAGQPHPDINAFNTAVKAQAGDIPDITTEDAIKKGQRYAKQNPGRFKGLLLAAGFLEILGTLTEGIAVANELTNPEHPLSRGIEAAQEGNMPRFAGFMTDDIDSVYMYILVEKQKPTLATTFKTGFHMWFDSASTDIDRMLETLGVEGGQADVEPSAEVKEATLLPVPKVDGTGGHP